MNSGKAISIGVLIMKIFIMTDMEGVCGVLDHDNWVSFDGRYYEEGKKLLTLEINAAIEGFFSAGATEIVVADGHGCGGVSNLLLDKRVLYQRGFPGPYPFGLDNTFDAMAWIGQHAKAGTAYAHIAHTGWFDVLDCRINGLSVGEFGELALLGAYLGVTPVFGSGDEAFAKEAAAFAAGIETVAVKKGLNPGSGDEYDCEGYRNRSIAAIHKHPEKARELIFEGAVKSLQKFKAAKDRFKVPRIMPPYRMETIYRPNGNKPAHRAFREDSDDLIAMMNKTESLF